ncbi:MAG: transporter ATP-binding protein [Francisellaceae bacterium]|nr:transporter ATP-binding protein [Francisellaceae bacterium]
MSRPFRWHFLGLMFISLVWAFDLSFRPFLVKIILDKLSVYPPADIVAPLMLPIIAYIGMSLVIVAILRWYNSLFLKVFPRLKQRIFLKITGHMLGHSHTYYQNYFSGALVNKIQDVANGLVEILKIIIDKFFSYASVLLVAIFTLYQVDIRFSLIMIVWSLIFFLVSIKWAKKIHGVSAEVSETQSQFIGKMVDVLSNMSLVRLFSGTKQEKTNLSYWSEQNVKIEQRFDRLFFKAIFIQSLSFVVLQAVCLIFLVKGRKDGHISVGDFALILTINIHILDCLWNLSKDFLKFTDHLGKATQGLRLTTLPTEIKDSPDAKVLKVIKGEIQFKEVTFQYGEQDPLFENKNVVIKGGEKIGLVGYSGSGKSSFVNLLLRLFDIQKGQILIDGQDISKVTQESLRQSIGMIPQDPTLFHRTIMENIRYGRFEATDNEVYEAAIKAHAHDFILNQPKGYESLAGEKGGKLSGGQRQRIAIARAILKNAPILLLDEATSALDSITEHLIQESLNHLMQNKTTIVIAHRLSTLLHMDRILVFHKGQIIQEGTHHQLLEQGGLYKNLWDAQMEGFVSQPQHEEVLTTE